MNHKWLARIALVALGLVFTAPAWSRNLRLPAPSPAIPSSGLASGDISLEDNKLYLDLTNDADTYVEQNTTSDTMRIAVGGEYIDLTESTSDDIDFNGFAFKETSYVIPTTVTVTANAATIDWANGVFQVLDLQGSSAAVTVTLSNPRTGGSYFIKVIQGDNGDTITWPAAVKWTGGTAPTISATEDYIDSVACAYDGTIYMCSWIGDYQ